MGKGELFIYPKASNLRVAISNLKRQLISYEVVIKDNKRHIGKEALQLPNCQCPIVRF